MFAAQMDTILKPLNTPKASESIKSDKLPTIRRKITPSDAERMAELMADRITEAGAALILKIKPMQWYQWKERHKTKFEEVYTRIREFSIKERIDNIKRAESGGRPDWRASHALLKIKDPERFGDQPAQVQLSQAAIPADLIARLLGQAFASSVPKALPSVVRQDGGAIEVETVKICDPFSEV